MDRNERLFGIKSPRDTIRFCDVPRLAALFPISASADIAGDPLPSWNDTANKKAIVTFVELVSKQRSPDLSSTRHSTQLRNGAARSWT